MKKLNRKLQALVYVGLAIGTVFLLQFFFKGMVEQKEKYNREEVEIKKGENSMEKVFMQRAIELASENIKNGGGPFAAVIVKNGEIIAETGNSVTVTNDPTAHAEVNAIRAACKDLNTFELSGCEIYSSCEPCPMCMAAIYWARMDKLYFAATRYDAAKSGFDDEFLYKELPLPYNERKLPIMNIMEAEGSVPFKEWDEFDKKIRY